MEKTGPSDYRAVDERLVLADGLSLAVEEEPDAIVDIATLTGACIIALGAGQNAHRIEFFRDSNGFSTFGGPLPRPRRLIVRGSPGKVDGESRQMRSCRFRYFGRRFAAGCDRDPARPAQIGI